MKPSSGIISTDASSTSVWSCCANAPFASHQPSSISHWKIRSRTAVQRARSAGRERSWAIRIARASATQHISREWVNRWRPPRVSQMPSSGASQVSQTQSAQRAMERQPS